MMAVDEQSAVQYVALFREYAVKRLQT